MNIYELNLENKEEKRIAQLFETDNFYVLYESNEHTTLSCTCGYVNKFKTRGYSTTPLPKKCPCCNTEKHIYHASDYDNTIIAWIPEVITDNEEQLHIGVKIGGIIKDEYNDAIISYIEGDEPSIYIRINKKTRDIKFYDEKYDTEEDAEGYELEVKRYQEGRDLYVDFEIFADCSLEKSAPGVMALIGLIKPYLNLEIDDEMSLDSIIYNAKLSQYPFILSGSKSDVLYPLFKNVVYLQEIDEIANQLTELDVNLNESDVLIALGIASYSIKRISNIEELRIIKEFLDNIKIYHLEEYLEFHNVEITNENITSFQSTFEQSSCDEFEKFMKYVLRGACNECISPQNILGNIREVISNGKEYVLDYAKAYSCAQYKKAQMISAPNITEEQYNLLNKKPTLDTAFKLFCK